MEKPGYTNTFIPLWIVIIPSGPSAYSNSVRFLYNSALMNVKRQLVSGDYIKALAVLKAATVTWPDYEMFSKTTTEESKHNGY